MPVRTQPPVERIRAQVALYDQYGRSVWCQSPEPRRRGWRGARACRCGSAGSTRSGRRPCRRAPRRGGRRSRSSIRAGPALSRQSDRAREFTSTASTDACGARSASVSAIGPAPHPRSTNVPERRRRRCAAQQDRGSCVEASVAEDATVGLHGERHVRERDVDRARVGSRLRRLLEVVVRRGHETADPRLRQTRTRRRCRHLDSRVPDVARSWLDGRAG